MATHTGVFTITFEDEQAPNVARFEQAEDTAVRELAAFLDSLSTGHRQGSLVVAVDDVDRHTAVFAEAVAALTA